MEKENKVNEFSKIFIIFMIGSIIGYIVEMIVALVQNGHFESRQGLIYGPFTPVYGIGIITYYIIFKFVKTRNKGKVFLISMLLGGIIEYLCSYLQEKIFGTVSWDYSNWIFNINGRTTLIHSAYWGIAGILYVMLIEPIIPKIDNFMKDKYMKLATNLLLIFMVFNISISTIAALRQNKRANNIPPENGVEVFLDNHYPDEYMEEVFANARREI